MRFSKMGLKSMSPKGDIYYIQKVIKDLEFVMDHTKNISQSDFENDEVLQDSIMFRFIQISENIKKLSITFKDSNALIPWNQIIGLRNRIVHEYGTVDRSIIYNTVKNDIDYIYQAIQSIVK